MFFPLSRVVLLLFCLLAAPGWAAQVSLTFDSIRHDVFEADGMTLSFDAQRQGEADIRLRRLRVGGLEYRELRLHCSDFYFDGKRLDCPRGTVRREDERGSDRPPLAFSLAYRASDGFFEFALHDVDAVDLSPLVKKLRAWRPEGKVDFRVAVHGGKAVLQIALRDVGFARGDLSAKGIVATVDVAAERQRDGWDWQASIDWPQGELARPPWRRAGGVRIGAAGRFTPAVVDVRQARLEVAGFGAVNASLLWDRARDETTAWGFVTERLDLATAMREWVQPWLAQLGFPAWRTEGHALFSAEAKNGRLLRFYAGLEDATIADATGHIELRGMSARIPWEADAPTTAEFGVTAGALGDLPLGKFSFPIYIAGREARIRNLVAPMLDGKFTIDVLTLGRGDDGWHGEFSGGIDGVSMPKLSHALGMPVMAGEFTARIPRVAYDKGALALDGALAIQVFDGAIAVHRLRVIDAFSAERRFLVDVTASNLDLGMLTQTFSFGSIAGRFDAELHNLEMAGWKPLRFQARLASTPGDYPREVSLGALRDIAAMGESAGATALKGLPERSFGFGYARIGIGATLENGVCTIEGIGRDDGGIVLMEGSGFPSVRIIGYNSRVDWDALVARIREVLAGKSAMLIK
ncbi:MAG: hypothetical protein PHY45_17935 [Rhodocyclaceae bacterium]|nr:hypothetical protein [Rhodocyclaceae bacterium]